MVMQNSGSGGGGGWNKVPQGLCESINKLKTKYCLLSRKNKVANGA